MKRRCNRLKPFPKWLVLSLTVGISAWLSGAALAIEDSTLTDPLVLQEMEEAKAARKAEEQGPAKSFGEQFKKMVKTKQKLQQSRRLEKIEALRTRQSGIEARLSELETEHQELQDKYHDNKIKHQQEQCANTKVYVDKHQLCNELGLKYRSAAKQMSKNREKRKKLVAERDGINLELDFLERARASESVNDSRVKRIEKKAKPAVKATPATGGKVE
jgi:hypothetical protein